MDSKLLKKQNAEAQFLAHLRNILGDENYECALGYMNAEVANALRKHPKFPEKGLAGLACVLEELGEVAECFNKQRGLETADNAELPMGTYKLCAATEAAHTVITSLRLFGAAFNAARGLLK